MALRVSYLYYSLHCLRICHDRCKLLAMRTTFLSPSHEERPVVDNRRDLRSLMDSESLYKSVLRELPSTLPSLSWDGACSGQCTLRALGVWKQERES